MISVGFTMLKINKMEGAGLAGRIDMSARDNNCRERSTMTLATHIHSPRQPSRYY